MKFDNFHVSCRTTLENGIVGPVIDVVFSYFLVYHMSKYVIY